MNRKLTDAQIASALELLRQQGRPAGWRSLQALLRTQYGTAGRTDRLRSACRANQMTHPQHLMVVELRRRAEQSEQRSLETQQARDLALARALRSEERETAHQDRWAAEIHALRETVEQLKGERIRRRNLEDQLVRLQRELQSAYSRLARYER